MDLKLFKFLEEDNANAYYFKDSTSPENASVVYISVPWSLTSAKGEGSSYAPDAIIEASGKISSFDAFNQISMEGKVSTLDIDYEIQEKSIILGEDVWRIFDYLRDGGLLKADFFGRKVKKVNEGILEMRQKVYQTSKAWAEKGKIIGIIGGDHSVSYGAVKALAEQHDQIGVLFLDAQPDMIQDNYDIKYSHRTIARDIINDIPQVSKMVQAGIRDITEEEYSIIQINPKVELFLMEQMEQMLSSGETWNNVCEKIINRLPEKIYVSVDIDVLNIECCSHTISPLPGGMPFGRLCTLLNMLQHEGKQIVGFDITEVVPIIKSKVDSLSAAKLLAKLTTSALKQKK
ncbi:MAG: arginase family protein [Alistipes sp.]|nr:arginase family protein [Candidatus Alistipes equi]